MKNSIRTKLFLGIGLLILLFISLAWVLNSQCLEKYYLMHKKNALKEICRQINETYKGNPEEIALELEQIENTNGINIMIVSKNREMKYSSFGRVFNQKTAEHRPPPLPDFGRGPMMHPDDRDGELKNIQVLKEELESGGYLYKIEKDTRLKIDFLSLFSLLDTGDILLLRAPLASISESAKIANRFMLFSGIIIIILGIIYTYFFSRRFTRPILELNRVARNIANLDFSQRCTIENQNDEIGELGKSINHLCEQLDRAISELNEKNKKLLAEIEKERKIDEMRKEFIANVSHELKTPISLIQGYAEGLKDNVAEDEASKNYYCDVIIDETDKMDRLVKDLLNLSQMESGFFRLERTDFNLSSLIDHVLCKYETLFKEKEICLSVEKDAQLIANGDMNRIEQILVNYLTNALNHVDNRKLIKVIVEKRQGKIRVSVFNSGSHIPADSLDKIWTSFYKVDRARKREDGGYGLGLSIVRAIQELHSNQFGVENVEGGVLFWFEIDSADIEN